MAGQPPMAPPPMAPPPPPPPPPPYGGGYGEGMGSKPTSGKAIASLICGLVGLIVFCYVTGIASLVGLVLGVLALTETGKEGKRSGRGLAIAGTAVSIVAIGAMIAWIGFIVFVTSHAEENFRATLEPQINADQALIMKRLKEYYVANENSLGPGGPFLAGRSEAKNDTVVLANMRVQGPLTVEALATVNELSLGGGMASSKGSKRRSGMGEWTLIVNGKSSATLRATDWGGNVLREIEIRDIGRDDFVQTK